MARTLTIPQIEREKGIPAATLHYWIKNGLPAVKEGRDYKIDLDALQKFIDERVEVGTVYKLKELPPNTAS